MNKLHGAVPPREADVRLAGRVMSSTVLQNPAATSCPDAYNTVLRDSLCFFMLPSTPEFPKKISFMIKFEICIEIRPNQVITTSVYATPRI